MTDESFARLVRGYRKITPEDMLQDGFQVRGILRYTLDNYDENGNLEGRKYRAGGLLVHFDRENLSYATVLALGQRFTFSVQLRPPRTTVLTMYYRDPAHLPVEPQRVALVERYREQGVI